MGANVSSETSFEASASFGGDLLSAADDPHGLSSSIGSGAVTSESLESKSKSRTFASTIHRHLTRKMRNGGKHSQKHSRVFREFLQVWPTAGLLQLVSQYEAVAVLRELHLQAECARPPNRSVADDLFDLLHDSHCADINVKFNGHSFAVHKALVCARCPPFRKTLGKVYEYGASVPLELPQVPQLTVELFERLLQYVYTGRWSMTAATIGKSKSSKCKTESITENGGATPIQSSGKFNANRFDRLPEEWLLKLHLHVPNELNKDLKHLLDTGLYSDATLVFISASATATSVIAGCPGCEQPIEYSCHMAVLAARSRFFRSAIKRELRRMRGSELGDEQQYRLDTTRHKVRIVLDDRFVPRRFARVILHSLYQDGDFSHLLTDPPCQCPHQPKADSYLNELFELYHLARLLEIDALARQSEDLLLNKLSMHNALSVLRWTRNGFGSAFVRRQLMQMCREQFGLLAASSMLFELSRQELFELISSEFVQASELELLQSVVRWGEQKMVKQMQDLGELLMQKPSHQLFQMFILIFDCLFVYRTKFD
jgi:BTB/POZ domain-containing protein 7